MTYKSADTDDGIGVGEKRSDIVLGSIKEGKGKSRKDHRNIQPGYPS
jgi:hypothetical protein